MKTKTKGFLLTASIVLATTFTLSCSGDDGDKDDGGGGYLSCAEAAPLFGAVEAVEDACSQTCPDEDDNCIFSCMEKDETVKRVCGGNSIGACKNHYNTCGSESGGGGGGGGYTGSYGSVKDAAGKSYKTVQIGTQTWMAQNLNYAFGVSKCLNESSGKPTDNEADCTKYGRLYDWATAKTACPSGWHLPSKNEFETLVTTVGGSSTAGTKLKATSGWSSSGNGTDNYGFSALPGGDCDLENNWCDHWGNSSSWWSATEYITNLSGDYAYTMHMTRSSEEATLGGLGTSVLIPVRCVKN